MMRPVDWLTVGRRILPYLAALGGLPLTYVMQASAAVPTAGIPADFASRTAAAPVKIRVRLAEALPDVRIRGMDLRIFEKEASQRRLVRVAGNMTEWSIRCQDGRIRAISGARELELKEPVSIQTPAGFLTFRGKPYRDELRVYSIGSFCEVVNEVEIEKYLDGLVNSEFNSKWNEEAIEAQVVAARTYALFQIRAAREKTSHFDVDGNERDQVYDGSIREDFRASRAVEKSRGIVLLADGTDGRPLPLKAFYHSTCGGMTDLPENVWGRAYPGFRRTVLCPFCAHSPAFHWELALTTAQIVQAFSAGARSDAPPVSWPANWATIIRKGRLVDLRPGLARGERVVDLVTLWEEGRHTYELRVSGPKFREWIGPGKLRSSTFDIQGRGSVWTFVGRGNGHGVGMCQWGAKVMGDRGYTMSAILRHYYPDAFLRKLW